MGAYTKEQFEQYKDGAEHLIVSYEFKGSWQDVFHSSYEDYIHCYTLYSFVLKTIKDSE